MKEDVQILNGAVLSALTLDENRQTYNGEIVFAFNDKNPVYIHFNQDNFGYGENGHVWGFSFDQEEQVAQVSDLTDILFDRNLVVDYPDESWENVSTLLEFHFYVDEGKRILNVYPMVLNLHTGDLETITTGGYLHFEED